MSGRLQQRRALSIISHNQCGADLAHLTASLPVTPPGIARMMMHLNNAACSRTCTHARRSTVSTGAIPTRSATSISLRRPADTVIPSLLGRRHIYASTLDESTIPASSQSSASAGECTGVWQQHRYTNSRDFTRSALPLIVFMLRQQGYHPVGHLI